MDTSKVIPITNQIPIPVATKVEPLDKLKISLNIELSEDMELFLKGFQFLI
jgi:hypothetical protein